MGAVQTIMSVSREYAGMCYAQLCKLLVRDKVGKPASIFYMVSPLQLIFLIFVCS